MKSFLLAIAFLLTASSFCFAQQSCASHEYQQLLAKNPSLKLAMQKAESLSQYLLQNEILTGTPNGNGGGGIPLIRIPVIVHVLYNAADQNISDEQVFSQIDVLNREFGRSHADTSLIPLAFQSLAANCLIEFVPATINPKGYASNGIVRKKTNAYSFGMDDKIKFSSTGGDDAWDRDRYLNIWVGNLSAGIIGYASPLGGPKETDGVVIRYTAFGNKGRLAYPYTKGRIAVHELGHWLGLRHIWGDQFCGSDGVDDTPVQSQATRGCPAGIINSCDGSAGGIMYNNYMDLTNDDCTNMFTIGQSDKMRSAFAYGAPRNALLSSNAATAIPLPEPPPIAPTAEIAFRVFPNPAVSSITIDISGIPALSGNIVGVYNQLGQQVMQFRLAQNTTTVNLISLRDGVYFFHLGMGTKPYKLLKSSGIINNP